MPTTPLEREILTHYATGAGPYRGGSENWTETHLQIVRRFIDLGLLISYKGADGQQRIRQNEEALRVYMAALAAVPLPVQRWVVPSAHDSESGKVCSELTQERKQRVESRDAATPDTPLAPRDATEARVVELERQVRALQTDVSPPRRERYGLEED
jgi:hypothetical protein